MTVSLPSGGKGTGQFVHNVMFTFKKDKKQIEELNSSQIKEILISYEKALVQLKELYDEACISGFEFHTHCDELCQMASALIADIGSNGNNLYEYFSSDGIEFSVQSDSVVVETTSAATSEQINVGFDDLDEGSAVLSAAQKWYTPSTVPNTDLNDFLKRPVKIRDISWSLGGSINSSFPPWYEYLNHPSIKRKIDNYAFLRGNLRLKFVINASPFYYGAVLCAYKPLNGVIDSAPVDVFADHLVSYSQRPHVWIYPQTCEGGEIMCPYISTTEWLNITSGNEITNFGRIHMDSVGVLLNANSVAVSDINIQVYAWLEDVELSGLTVGLSVQSDEYKRDGAVSKPASAIARATGSLSKLPIIGPYMTATSVAAGAVANIASLFGYTKVPVCEDTKPFKNLPFHGLGVSDISGPTERLTIDSKNELTINNECIGDVIPDNLQITHFVQRSSYLTSFTWQATDSLDTLLWNSYVNPFMSTLTTGVNQTLVNPTPMWVASNLFSYWRGDIIYDFKILCSQYHRGRLRFSWDPVGDVANTADSTTEVYTHILDITEDTNVSIRIPYNQRVAYLKTPTSYTATIFGASPLATDSSDTVNGILTVRVLNEQTSPVATANITVMVSVRGAENLEFAAPKDVESDLYSYSVQSEICLGSSSQTDSNLNLVYMGEKVVSFRQLMMRANYSTANYYEEQSDRTYIDTVTMNRRPLFKGFDPNGINLATGLTSAATEPYNFVKLSAYHLVSTCFLGERGSFTWNVCTNSYQPMTIFVHRQKKILTVAQYKVVGQSAGSNRNNWCSAMSDSLQSSSGSLMINERTNTGVSFNAPMYSNFTMLDTSPATRTLGKSNLSADDSVTIMALAKPYKERIAEDYPSTLYFNVGPDYSSVFFLNVPTYYVYASAPAWVADP